MHANIYNIYYILYYILQYIYIYDIYKKKKNIYIYMYVCMYISGITVSRKGSALRE